MGDEVVAKLRYYRMSPRKMRLVADLIRGKSVEDALTTLRFLKKKAATPIAKLIKSAIANAENRWELIDVGELYIKEIFVDQGPMLKRFRPAPMGRAHRILKRTSHVTVKLSKRR